MKLKYIDIKNDVFDEISDLSLILITNYKKTKKYHSLRKSNCFRVYDKDISRFPVTIDYYDGLFVINYYWKKESSDREIKALSNKVNNSILQSFSIEQNSIIHKNRKVNYDSNLFKNSEGESNFFSVYENGIKFEINLKDYLDTGIFLDHTPAREIAMWMAKDKKVLNLFSYTSSFSLYVLKGGAKFCKSVDISNTYVEWSIRNHIINSIDKSKYEIRKDDCLAHLKFLNKKEDKFDLIIMDPPTLSRAKKMKKSIFHVQKNHKQMLIDGCNLLNKGGVLLFSNNLTTFKMDREIGKNYIVEDISNKTIPYGFKNRKIHKTFLIRNR